MQCVWCYAHVFGVACAVDAPKGVNATAAKATVPAFKTDVSTLSVRVLQENNTIVQVLFLTHSGA